MPKKDVKKLAPRDDWSLREVKRALALYDKSNLRLRSDIGGNHPAIEWDSPDGRAKSYLPQLRTERFTVYSGKEGYEKRVDALISKHGPDARFPSSEKEGGGGLTVEPIKESDNAGQVKLSKEASPPAQKGRGANAEADRSVPEENPYSTTVDKGQSGVGHRGLCETKGEEVNSSWDISLGSGKNGARQGAELPGPQSQDSVYSESLEGDKAGLSPSPDTLASVSKGNAFPGDKNGPSKEAGQDDKNGSIFRSPEQEPPGMTFTTGLSPKKLNPGVTRYDGSPTSGALGDVSSPLNPFSFGTFALYGAKGQRAWGLSNPSTKISLKDLIGSKALSSGLDESWLREDTVTLSREGSFRSGSPGGYVDEHKARLEKKSIKGQARKIARYFAGFFRDNEVGIGTEQTPRISGAKIVKELLGKSARLSRAKKEEKGAGLKLILVDISPSCGSIRDACFAAALAIAEQDPNVVVLAHFNGYTATSDGHIIGYRQKEIPHIYCTSDLTKFEAFLAKGKVSGVVCFGDDDASEVYSLLSRYCPTLWLSPDEESHCRYVLNTLDKGHLRAYSEARMYIIGGVTNAQSAVEGLKKLKGKK